MRCRILSLLVLIAVTSCDQLEEVGEPPVRSELDGNWVLGSARCFCFFPDDFDFARHQLDFDSVTNEVRVENSEETFFIIRTGTYPYAVEGDRITINGTLVYTYRIEGNSLILSFVDDPQLADDEISLFYSKPE